MNSKKKQLGYIPCFVPHMDAKHFPQIAYLAVHIDHLIFPIVFT